MKFEPIGTQYDKGQLKEIEDGLRKGEDLSWFANPQFNKEQMQQIRMGLNNKPQLDVSAYASPKFTWKKMRKIREQLLRQLETNKE